MGKSSKKAAPAAVPKNREAEDEMEKAAAPPVKAVPQSNKEAKKQPPPMKSQVEVMVQSKAPAAKIAKQLFSDDDSSNATSESNEEEPFQEFDSYPAKRAASKMKDESSDDSDSENEKPPQKKHKEAPKAAKNGSSSEDDDGSSSKGRSEDGSSDDDSDQDSDDGCSDDDGDEDPANTPKKEAPVHASEKLLCKRRTPPLQAEEEFYLRLNRFQGWQRKMPAPDPSPTRKAKKAAAEEKAVAAAEASPPPKVKNSKVEPEQERKRPASDPAPTSKAKRAKAGEEKAVAGAEATPPEATPLAKGKCGNKLEKPAALTDPSPSVSKSKKTYWGRDDGKKILDALKSHVNANGVLPKTEDLIATVGDRLIRKDCNYTVVYEKVRRLKEKYEKAVRRGIVPSKDDELLMYNLSKEIWGKKAMEPVSAVTSQKAGALTNGKKGQANKEKMDHNAKGGTTREAAQQGSKKGQEGEIHVDETKGVTNVQGVHRGFDELQKLYPNLAFYVENIEAIHGKRAQFELRV